MHEKKSPLAGRKVRIKDHVKHRQFPNFGGSEFVVEDWWDHGTGKTWRESAERGNPGALVYALRIGAIDNVPASGYIPIPQDDEVLYGHSNNGLGSLVHISEIEL